MSDTTTSAGAATASPSPETLAVVGVPRRWSSVDFVLLFTALAITTWVRATHIDRVPSFDELWHLAITTGHGSPLANYAYDVVHRNARVQTGLDDAAPIWSIWTDMRGVLHPPLFMVTLRAWRSVVGQSDLAAHWLSISWGAVGLAFLFATARSATDRWLAMVVTLAMGSAQTQVYLAQEIRSYAMLNALGSIALWLMTRVELFGSTRRRAIALGALTLPIVLTHYFGFGCAVAIGVYGLWRLAGHRRAFVVTAAAAAMVFLVTWVPIALRQTRDFSTGDGMMKTDGIQWTHEALMTVAAPFRVLADRTFHSDTLPLVTGVLFVLPWLLIRRFRVLLPWVIWLCVSLGCLVMLDLVRTTKHVAYVRYLSICSPAVPLLFVGVIWPIRRALAYVAGIGIGSVGVLYLITGNVVTIDAQDYDDVVRAIAPRIQPGEPILVYDADPVTGWRPPVWMMTLSHAPGLFPRPMAMLSRPMSLETIDALESRSAWLVTAEGIPPDWLVPGARVTERRSAWEEIAIYRLEIDRSEAARSIASRPVTTSPAFVPAAPAAPRAAGR